MSLLARLNHSLTRWDTREELGMQLRQRLKDNANVSGEAVAAKITPPIRRKLVPALAVGLGGSLLISNARKAFSSEDKKKSLIRDVLVVGGAIGGLIAGLRFSQSYTATRFMAFMSKVMGRGEIHFSHMNLPKQTTDKLKSAGIMASHDHHHHAHDGAMASLANVSDKAIDAMGGLKQQAGRLIQLFQSSTHDHGIPGFVTLESIAGGSILGGVGAGMVADFINGEDLKKTGSNKIKEGLFQFVGNITFCTAAILAMTTGGKALAKLPFKGPQLREAAEATGSRLKTTVLNATAKVTEGGQKLAEVSTTRKLNKLAKKEDLNLGRVPRVVTELVESAHLEAKAQNLTGEAKQAFIKDHVMHRVDDSLGNDAVMAVLENIDEAIATEAPKQVEAAAKKAVDQLIRTDLKTVLNAGTDQSKAVVTELSKKRTENIGELMGVVIGLVTGVLGGAWTSNQVNEFLTKKMGLAEGHTTVSLFSTPSAGWGNEKLGDRGLHWWDGLLHVDDWPSALYMAGVQSLESVIWVLYTISGYLAGTAGTDYSAPPLERKPVDMSLFQKSPPLQRRYRGPQ